MVLGKLRIILSLNHLILIRLRFKKRIVFKNISHKTYGITIATEIKQVPVDLHQRRDRLEWDQTSLRSPERPLEWCGLQNNFQSKNM